MSPLSKWYSFGRDETYDRAMRAFEASRFEEALAEFSRCAQESREPATKRLANAHIAECHGLIAAARMRSSAYSEAIKHYAIAIAKNPHYADLQLGISLAYRANGQHDEHLSHLKAALRINPKFAAALLWKGIALYAAAQYAEAIAAIRSATELESGLANERYHFAIQCHERGDTSRALANFKSLTSTVSQDANTHAQIGDTFLKEGRYLEAGAEYARSLEIAPNYADVRCKYGQVLLELDQLEPAEFQLLAALAKKVL